MANEIYCTQRQDLPSVDFVYLLRH